MKDSDLQSEDQTLRRTVWRESLVLATQHPGTPRLRPRNPSMYKAPRKQPHKHRSPSRPVMTKQTQAPATASDLYQIPSETVFDLTPPGRRNAPPPTQHSGSGCTAVGAETASPNTRAGPNVGLWAMQWRENCLLATTMTAGEISHSFPRHTADRP
ncbi:hypothetical protein K461DRAFT_119094 [Myriangium duriaei CBS 260.36]|uniref:Uncharacterized protein n=1 Tax=Myriangium duriaei CBS 260.36 TaxID=1168546 RepID=A0A9P4J4H0_9PEZI|nr:hypothetical protein K461DRAFT_119094 [Myriangium duriaei CBS 260.36]